MKSGATIVTDSTKKVYKAIAALGLEKVYVGVPSINGERKQGDPANNAQLGYIHEFGAPDKNIPARPHLIPGIKDDKANIVKWFRVVAVAGLAGDLAKQNRALHAVGLSAQNAVRRRITLGPFVPLSERTLRARAARAGKGKGVAISKGAQLELDSRAAGNAPSTEFAKPLMDTGQYRQSITYVIGARTGTSAVKVIG